MNTDEIVEELKKLYDDFYVGHDSGYSDDIYLSSAPDYELKKLEDFVRTKVATLLTSEAKKREEAVRDALEQERQFILNVLDGIDIADGRCTTKAIRFALESRSITNPNSRE